MDMVQNLGQTCKRTKTNAEGGYVQMPPLQNANPLSAAAILQIRSYWRRGDNYTANCGFQGGGGWN